MNCRETSRKLLSLVAQRLEPAEAQLVEAHLKHCAHCARTAKELRETWTQLGTATQIEPRPDFNAGVLARAAERKAFGFGWPPWSAGQPVRALALATCLGVAAWFGAHARQPGQAQQGSEVVNVLATFTGAFGQYPVGSVGEAYVSLVSATAGDPNGGQP